MKSLRLSPDLALPLDAVTEKIAFLGRTGGGKTYAAQKLAEEMAGAGAQIVALDPVGKWWSLRLAADGKSPGIAIPVFGGLHGDVPLEPTAGALMANLIVDRGISAILDVSMFESDAQKARFAQDFADRFFFRKKASPSAVHVFIEEAQEFVPQNTMKGEERMLHAFQRLEKLGRNFGIGVSLISQRPQEVSKKALNQTELLFAFQMTGPQERKTIEGWISEKGVDEDIAGSLPKLKQGHAHVWSPAWLDISKEVHVSEKWTFDDSSSPKVGGAVSAPARTLAPIDLEKIRKDVAATIEKAKAEDPKELNKRLSEKDRRIAELERELAKKPAAAAPKIEKISVPVISPQDLARLESYAARIEKESTLARDSCASIRILFRDLYERVDDLRQRAPIVPIHSPRATAPPSPLRGAQARRSPVPARTVQAGTGSGDPSLTGGFRKILVALAQADRPLSRGQIALRARTSAKSSSLDTWLSRGRSAGWIEGGGDSISITAAGFEAVGSYQQLPVGAELREHWLAFCPGKMRDVLQVLFAAYPDALTRDEIADRAGTSTTSSSLDTWLSRLRGLGLIERKGRGIGAAEELFS